MPSSWWRAEPLVTPVLAFAAFYLAALAIAFALFPPATMAAAQWTALAAAMAGTLGAPLLVERRVVDPGLAAPRSRAIRDLAIGVALAAMTVGAADLAIFLSGEVAVGPGDGVAWGELLLVLVPAVVHEELVFRGYPFTALARGSRVLAIGISSFVFAALHAGNPAVERSRWSTSSSPAFSSVLRGSHSGVSGRRSVFISDGTSFRDRSSVMRSAAGSLPRRCGP